VELVQDEEARLEVLGNIHDNAALLSREYRESLEAEMLRTWKEED
jgi:hypothetical protein